MDKHPQALWINVNEVTPLDFELSAALFAHLNDDRHPELLRVEIHTHDRSGITNFRPIDTSPLVPTPLTP